MLNQIALKPFLGRVAQREGQSYESLMKSAASDLASLNADEFLSSPEAQANQGLGRVLRVSAADAQEITADFTAQKVDLRVTGAFIAGMATTALAMDPGTALGLDGAMRLLMMGEKPLAESSVKDDQLTLQPSLQQVAGQLETDVPGLLKQAAGEYKAHPEFDADSKKRADAAISTASVIKLNDAEVGSLRSTLAQEGLNDYQQDALISGLVMNAVAYEPTFRAGLDGIFGMYYRNEKPFEESSFQPVG